MENRDNLICTLSSFNRKELFLWTQITAIHPNNQKYQLRFELLTGLILSLDERQFTNHALSRENYEEIIRLFNEEFGGYFAGLEDWQPFNQQELIPFILDKNVHYCFYGLFERPLELYNKLKDLLLLQETNERIQDFKDRLLASLRFQTQLLESIKAIKESKHTDNNVLIPSIDFYERLITLFIAPANASIGTNYHRSLEFQHPPRQLMQELMNARLFRKHIVIIDGDLYYLLPQIHLQTFYDSINELILTRTINSNELTDNLRLCLFRKAMQFFTVRNHIHAILTVKNVRLDHGIDFISAVDGNRLLLFKIASCSTSIDCSKEICEASTALNDTIDNILKEDIVGFADYHSISGVPTAELHIYGFLIYENTHMDLRAQLPKLSNELLFQNWMNLKCMFEVIDGSSQFIKFINDNKDFEGRTEIITAEYLDRLAYYVGNNYSFPTAGIRMNVTVYHPHQWYYFYFGKLLEKYNQTTSVLLELEYGDKFNKIETYARNIDIFYDTAYLDGGMTIRNGFIDNTIVLFPPGGFMLDGLNVEVYSALLGPLFAEYLLRLKAEFGQEFDKHGGTYEKYIICLYPKDVILADEKYSGLKANIDLLTDDEPMHIYTGLINERVLKTSIFYDKIDLQKKFDSQKNIGERYCMKKYYESILLFFDPKLAENTLKEKSESFIDNNIKISNTQFSYDAIPVENAKLKDYGNPIDNFDSEIMKVNKEISEYLFSENVRPGTYENKEALKINEIIYSFIEKRINETLQQFSKDILFFTYGEIELIEGKRENLRIKRNIDSNKSLQYDLIGYYNRTVNDLSNMAQSARIILQFILKTNPSGQKAITAMDWNYLQALGLIYFASSLIFDNINFNIQGHKIEITDAYELREHRESLVYNQQEFFNHETRLQIRKAKGHKDPVINIDGLFEKHFKDINREFDNLYGVSFEDMATVLLFLGRTNMESSHFPLTVIKVEELIRYLSENIRDINEDVAAKIIEFSSLSYNIYKDVKTSSPSRYNTQKERLNLCPLIRMDDSVLFGNQMCLLAHNVWLTNLSRGDFPFSLNKGSLKAAIDNYRKSIEDNLERVAIQISKGILGNDYVVNNLKKYRALGINKNGIIEGGEIDILAVHKEKRIIHVLEVKHRVRRFTPYDCDLEFKKFLYEGKSYLDKLEKKEKFVSKYKDEILKYFGIIDDCDWIVRKGFVVLHNYPFAFHSKYNIKVIMIDELQEYLANG